MAASASVEGLVVIWDMTQNKEKKGIVVVSYFSVPRQVSKKRGQGELSAISL